MRNGPTRDIPSTAQPEVEAANPLENISLQREPKKSDVTIDLDRKPEPQEDFSNTSFSFAVERKQTKEAPSLERAKNTPRVEQVRSRDPLATRQNAARKEKVKPTAAQRTQPASRWKFKLKGLSLLDRFVSFVAKILKAIEKFLIRPFTKNTIPTPTSTQNEKPEGESLNTQPQRARRRPPVTGPGI